MILVLFQKMENGNRTMAPYLSAPIRQFMFFNLMYLADAATNISPLLTCFSSLSPYNTEILELHSDSAKNG